MGTGHDQRRLLLRRFGQRQQRVDVGLVSIYGFVEVWHGDRLLAVFDRDKLTDWLEDPWDVCEINGVAFLAHEGTVSFYVRDLIPAAPIAPDVMDSLRQIL